MLTLQYVRQVLNSIATAEAARAQARAWADDDDDRWRDPDGHPGAGHEDRPSEEDRRWWAERDREWWAEREREAEEAEADAAWERRALARHDGGDDGRDDYPNLSHEYPGNWGWDGAAHPRWHGDDPSYPLTGKEVGR